MAAHNPERRRLSCTVAAIEKHNGADDPRIPPLRAELATEKLAEHIRSVIASAPPLTAEQAARLRALLPYPPMAVRNAS